MGFLKKHYEKILLAVLLTIFIGLLAFQLVLWRQNEMIQVEKMKEFKEPPPNYHPVTFEDAKSPFRALETLSEKPFFHKAFSREKYQSNFTNLMLPYPMAVCPYCRRVIPANAFPAGDLTGNCPFDDCKKTLRAPYNLTQEKDLDSDGDGIPDKEEIKMGLNPKDGKDAGADDDGDGFSNYEEYICKTDYKDPKSRPPYHEKMHVLAINRTKLLFRLKKLTFDGARTKENARIELEIEKPRKKVRFQTAFVRFGDVFPKLDLMDKGRQQQYIIVDVIPKFVKNNVTEVNESQLIVQKYNSRTKSGEGDKIPVEIGKDVYEPRVRAVVGINLVNDFRENEVYEGSLLAYGKELRTGMDKYTVSGIDLNKNTVTLKYVGDNKVHIGKDFAIEKVSMLQRKIDALRKSSRPRRPRRKTNN